MTWIKYMCAGRIHRIVVKSFSTLVAVLILTIVSSLYFEDESKVVFVSLAVGLTAFACALFVEISISLSREMREIFPLDSDGEDEVEDEDLIGEDSESDDSQEDSFPAEQIDNSVEPIDNPTELIDAVESEELFEEEEPSTTDPDSENIESVALTQINGIGPAIQDRLASVGVISMRDLAELTNERAGEIGEEIGVRSAKKWKQWIRDAKKLC